MWLSAMLRSPPLAEVVSLAALLSILVLVWLLTVYWKKTRSTGYVVQSKHSKRGKAKENKETFLGKLWLRHAMKTCLYHYIILRFCSKSTCLHSVVICFIFSSKVLLFLWFAKIYSNLGCTPKRGTQWHHFATTLTKSGLCSVSSSLWSAYSTSSDPCMSDLMCG